VKSINAPVYLTFEHEPDLATKAAWNAGTVHRRVAPRARCVHRERRDQRDMGVGHDRLFSVLLDLRQLLLGQRCGGLGLVGGCAIRPALVAARERCPARRMLAHAEMACVARRVLEIRLMAYSFEKGWPR